MRTPRFAGHARLGLFAKLPVSKSNKPADTPVLMNETSHRLVSGREVCFVDPFR